MTAAQLQPVPANVQCNICNNTLGEPIYHASSDRSLTSINTNSEQATTVWFCDNCSHTMSAPLEDMAGFYDESYSLGMQSEDEDQLMKVENGVEIYRTDYQKTTLLQKLDLEEGTRILDFGSGKAGTLKKLLDARSDLQGYAFDVSEHYIEPWRKFLPVGHYATHDLPEDWQGSMDVVMSFFMLEHVAEPLDILQTQYGLLRDGGTLYFVVPYLYKNPADMLVADHVNHFSLPSINFALRLSGFDNIEVDTAINPQWMVVTAHKAMPDTPVSPTAAELQECRKESVEIADYWQRMSSQVAEFLQKIPEGESVAIYGAGFYGNFIWENLPRHEQIACFIDRNHHLHGREHKGRQVMPPEQMDDSIQHVLVGLNPQIAKAAIQEVDAWHNRNITYHYLF